MTWAHPEAFWLLALVVYLFVLFLWNERRAERIVKALVAERLRRALVGTVSQAGRRMRALLFLLGLTAAIVALAQPRYGERVHEIKSEGRDVIVALDVSRSMLAGDLAPTRLTRAKQAVEDLIRQLRGDRVGLVAFAGSAFLQAPLTTDYAEVLTTLREMEPGVIPIGGTNIAEAIRSAVEAFGKGESEHRALVIFTDGEELEADATEAAREAAKEMTIFTIGCGTANGTLITIPNEQGKLEYVKGPDGQIVKSRLDEDRLRAIAEASGGFYTLLQNGPPEMQRLVRDGLDRLSTEEMEAMQRREPIERYQWPLSAAVLLLVASMLPRERRVGAGLRGAAAVMVAVIAFGTTAQAGNRGLEAYERKDYAGAKRSFEDQLSKRPDSPPLQFDLGASAYKAGELDKALEAFSKALVTRDPELRKKSEYNLGNTLYQRGAGQKEDERKAQDWRNSLQHFDEALKLQPEDQQAKENRAAVAGVLAKLEQKLEEKKQQQEQQKKEKQAGEKKEGEKGEKEEKAGEEKEGQQAGEQNGEQKGFKKDKDGKLSEGKEGEEKEGGKPEEAMKEDPEGKEKASKKVGEITDADAQKAEELREQAEREAEAREDAQAASEGKMTRQQAEELFNAARNQDRRVRLWDPRAKGQRPRANLRDW